MKRYNKEWNFYESDMGRFTHGFHSYPAMMVPDIIDKVIEEYAPINRNSVVFDPYMGSGTTLVQMGFYDVKRVVGTDINPLARLISEAKIKEYDLDKVDKATQKLQEYIMQEKEIETKHFPIIDTWFKEKNKYELSLLESFIQTMDGEERYLFLVTFTETIRQVSMTRNGEFKLYRIAEEKRADHNPDTYKTFFDILKKNIRLYIDYSHVVKRDKSIEIYDFNTTINIPDNIIEDDSVDLVITSPPYGDSSTTVAYGQFSRLANEWLGYEEPQRVDANLMGGVRNSEDILFDVPLVNELLDKLKKLNNKNDRYKDVEAFYLDYQKSIDNIASKIKQGGHVVYVVGNRRVCNIEMPTDEITIHFFENNNFSHVETIVREIQNKRLPSKTSPTNIKGEKVSTMSHEYIIILRKK